MISDRRDEAISHNHDGVRDEYIKHFRHTHVADCKPRFDCNESNQLGHRQPCFCRVGRFMHYLELLSNQLYVEIEARACAVAFPWAAASRHRVLGAGGVRHGGSGARDPSSGRAREVPNAYLKRRAHPGNPPEILSPTWPWQRVNHKLYLCSTNLAVERSPIVPRDHATLGRWCFRPLAAETLIWHFRESRPRNLAF